MTYEKYKSRTMCNNEVSFNANIYLVKAHSHIPGCIIECGTWKGGMIAAIAETLGDRREYILCDSFNGLPKVQLIDGPAAIEWQKNDPFNCRATIEDVREAMALSGVSNYKIVEGWFEDTLPGLDCGPIAILRLDADWYSSTMTCLAELFHLVSPGGLIIIDDYYVWDGCAKAVHRFLASTSDRICSHEHIAYIRKR